MESRMLTVVAGAMSVIAATLSAQPCEPQWSSAFANHIFRGEVQEVLIFDEGSGPMLYAFGLLRPGGGVPVRGAARFDGTSWEALSEGLGSSVNVRTAAVFDDGTGPAIHIGGSFEIGGVPTNVARWDGAGWRSLGGGTDAPVNALAVHEVGGRSALFAAGEFDAAGGVQAQRIARWDGLAWSSIGDLAGSPGAPTLAPIGSALASFDDGSGPALFVAGRFTSAGGISALNVARWDGAGGGGGEWRPAGSGLSGVNTAPPINTFAVHDDGSGPALYAGGRIYEGRHPMYHVVRWTGFDWQRLERIVLTGGAGVDALASFDDGSGPALWASSRAGFEWINASGLARYDGKVGEGAWVLMPYTLGIRALLADSTPHAPVPGAQSRLYAAGSFSQVEQVDAARIAVFEGSGGGGWKALQSPQGLDGSGNTLAEHNGAVYVGGSFSSAGAVPVSNIAQWDGHSWSEVGGGVGGQVSGHPSIAALASFDERRGAGRVLFAAGRFAEAGGNPASGLARFDGTVWSAVPGFDPETPLRALLDGAALPPPHEPGLYVGGSFTAVGGMAAGSIARWDGQQWHALGEGVHSSSSAGSVSALAIHDDGTGPALYAGGMFEYAGSASASSIARWDGQSWAPLGRGVQRELQTTTMPGWVWSMASFNDGTGPALYVGGTFTHAGEVAAEHLARWRHNAWEAFDSPLNSSASALAVFDDGSGPSLIVSAATVPDASGTIGTLLAWDGEVWRMLNVVEPGHATDRPRALLTVDRPGRAQSLFATGGFTHLGSGEAGAFAELRGCERCLPDCTGSGTLTVEDFTCFIDAFASALALPVPEQIGHYANCDGSTTEPILTVDDFTCFINEFAQGCP